MTEWSATRAAVRDVDERHRGDPDRLKVELLHEPVLAHRDGPRRRRDPRHVGEAIEHLDRHSFELDGHDVTATQYF